MAFPQQQQQDNEIFFSTGKVQQALDRHYVVVVDQRQIRAVQAAGCLLVPEPDDMVLLAEQAEGKTYIVSVLSRLSRTAKPARINLPADTVIAAQGGDLLLCADRKISLTAPNMHFQADRGVAEIRDADFTAEKVDISVSRLRAVWGAVETRLNVFFSGSRVFIAGSERRTAVWKNCIAAWTRLVGLRPGRSALRRMSGCALTVNGWRSADQ